MTKKDFKRVKLNISKIKFNLFEVVGIMFVTILCTITITISVSFFADKKPSRIKDEADLIEFTNTYNSLVNEYYTKIDKKELVNSAIAGMIDYLDDPYTDYFSKDESDSLTTSLDGQYNGIGVEILFDSNKKLVINKVYDDSPASISGLKEKDEIIKIDGEDISDKKISDITSLIKDKEKSEVKLQILRSGKKEEYVVSKAKIEMKSVSYRIIEKDNKKIAKVDITVFASNTYKQFTKVFDEIKKENIDGIILDLRDNTGGHLSVATSIIDMFLDKNVVMYRLQKDNTTKDIKSTTSKIIDIKTVILVNRFTASASEILASSLNENLGCELVGVTTYGKGKVQKTKQLSNGSTIKYTIERWLTSKGKEIDGKGLEPTNTVEQSKDYYKNRTDELDNQLIEAIKIIVENKK